MAVVRNTSRTFRAGSTSTNDVIADYQKFVQNIQEHAEAKVKQTVANITNITNSQYSGDNVEQNVSLTIDPIYYSMIEGKNVITGIAQARPIKEFVYLELGTRQSPNDSLIIKTQWDSGIDVLSAAAPYKSQNPKFFNKMGPIIGRYFFLNTIDKQGNDFIRNFWK
jgi:hypothetical protein